MATGLSVAAFVFFGAGGAKMAAAGADYMTDPATQIRWGLAYVRDTYGTPCGAWAHETSDGWY